jgi:hemoglobin/transferrin/lactoferrin receptor protein
MKENHRQLSSYARIILASLILVATGSTAMGLEGKLVLELDGTPVANAGVSVIGRGVSTRTDEEGRFTLTPDPPVPFELLVSLPGGRYMKPILVEEIPEDGVLVIAVSPLVTETVSVTAGVAPDIQTTPASGMTFIPEKELEIRQPVNLTQALESVPGVFNVSEGQAAVPAIRGLAQARSLILIDGARVTSERRVGPSATFLDPFVLEALEVSRGPGSVAYGSDAFGGVILARTRRPEPGAPLGIRLFGAAGGGIRQVRTAAELSSGVSKTGGVLFQAHYRNFEDYTSPEGEVFNSGASDHGFLGRFEQILKGGLLSVGWQSDFGRDIERPRTNSKTTRFYYPTEDSNRFTSSYEAAPTRGFSRLALETFLGNNRTVTDQDMFATDTSPRGIERSDVAASDFSVRATAERPWGDAAIGFGLDLNGRFGLEADDVTIDFDMEGNEVSQLVFPTIENAKRTDTGLFLEFEKGLGEIATLQGGVRGDHVASRNEGGYFGDLTTTNSAFSGHISATLGSMRGFSVTGQVARGFRDARLSDRFYRGVTGRGFITGNPDLEPETSLQFDGAVRYTAARWRWSFYLYEYHIYDLIERYEDEPDFFYFRNRGEARIRGVELEAQGDLGRGFVVELGGQATSGKALDDGTGLDDIGPPSIWIQGRKELGRGFFQLRAAFYASDHKPGPTEVPTPAYQLLDAAAGYKIHPRAELRFMARNLLDQSYPLSTDRRSPVAPGISGIATILIDF